MSTSCGFFNSLDGDRKYNATHFGHCFDGVILSGILASIGDCFIVKVASGMSINVGSGKAWYLGSWLENDADLPVEIEPSDVVLSRIDAVVMEFDMTENVRWNDIKVVKGKASSVPVRPALTNTKSVVQIPLAYISIRANASSISQSDITNVIGTTECPFVTGLLEVISVDKLLGQWQTQLDEWITTEEHCFSAWFQSIKDKLSEDAAGSLQNQIDQSKTASTVKNLSAFDWSGVGPYTQTITVEGLTAERMARVYPEYGDDTESNLAMWEACACVSYAKRDGSNITFTCLEDKPGSDIAVTVEVYV